MQRLGVSRAATPGRVKTKQCIGILLASLFVLPVWADGELDTSFGSRGFVRLALPDSSGAYFRDAAVVNGNIEAAGFSFDSTGASLIIAHFSLAGSDIG